MSKSELRREWTAEEVAEHARESDESLPQAMATPRRPEDVTAGGSEHLTGDELYEESREGEEQLVADPPERVDAAEQDQA